MAMIEQESLSEMGLRLHLFASELTDGFFAARTSWPGDQSQIHCTVFFRKAWRQRKSAYAFTMVQYYPSLHLAACLEPSLDEVYKHLRRFGYSGNETWLTISRSELHQYFIWKVEQRLWGSNEFNQNFFAEMS